MKSKIMMLFAATAIGFTACNDNTADNATTVDTTSSTTNNVSPTTNTDANASVEIPAPTRTSFETKYPNASNVKWSRYNPPADRTTIDKDDWRYNLDTSDYEVYFNWDGSDYYAWYDDGSWIHASSPVKDHAKLPAAVNKAIQAQFADYTIKEVDKEHDKDRVTYEVDLEKGDSKLKVHFDENGKVVKKKGDGTKVKEDSK